MNGKSKLDIEKGDDIPIVVPLLADDGPAFRRRTVVENIDPLEGQDTAPPRPVDYTFRGRHVEMIAIGISHFSKPQLTIFRNFNGHRGASGLWKLSVVGWSFLSTFGVFAHVDHSLCRHGTFQASNIVLITLKMSLREIITPFPIPGAVFSMANRVLCPAIVLANKLLS
jgi:hypothetical protein